MKTLFFVGIIFYCQAQKSIDSTYLKSLDSIGELSDKNLKEAYKSLNLLISEIKYKNGFFKENVIAYRQKAIMQRKMNIDSALFYYNKSIQLATHHNLDNELAKSTMSLAIYWQGKHKFRKADSIFQYLSEHSYYVDSDSVRIAYLLNYSSLLWDMQLTENSIKQLESALEIVNKYNFHSYDLHINHRLAGCYHNLNDFKRSLKYSKASLENIAPDDLRKYSIHNNIASAYINLESIDSAKVHLLKVINGSPMESSLIYSYQNLSNIEYKEEKYNSSNKFSDRCIELATKLSRPSSICNCNLNRAKNYYAMGQHIKSKMILDSIKPCIESYHKIMQGTNYKDLYFGNELALLGRCDLSLEWKRIILEKDSIRAGISSSQIKDVETKYKTQQKEAENIILNQKNDLHQATIKQQKSYLFSSLIGLLGLLIISILLWRRYLDKVEHNKRIQNLREEVDHRLRNQMNTALDIMEKFKSNLDNSLVTEAFNDFEQRLYALSSLSQLLSGKNMDENIPMSFYLEQVTKNLNFNADSELHEKLKVTYDFCEVTLSSKDALNVALIVTELFTNSLKHAFDESMEPKIEIQLDEVNEDSLKLKYKDNGKGLVKVRKLHGEGMHLIDSMMKHLGGEGKINTDQSGFTYEALFSRKSA